MADPAMQTGGRVGRFAPSPVRRSTAVSSAGQVEMSLRADLERSAFRFGDEYAWRRDDALRVVDRLAQEALAIVEGNTWLIARGSVLALVPQTGGIPATEHWSCERQRAEPWSAYVARAAGEARRAIQGIPAAGAADLPDDAVVHYNLRWAPEPGDDSLANQADVRDLAQGSAR